MLSTRLHSTVKMRSPVEFEADHAAGDPAGIARAGTRKKQEHAVAQDCQPA
jgi:hypothetical protein